MHGEWGSLDHPQTLEGVEGGHQMEEAFQVGEVGEGIQVKEAEEAAEGEVVPQMLEQATEPQTEGLRKMMLVQHGGGTDPPVQPQTKRKRKYVGT